MRFLIGFFIGLKLFVKSSPTSELLDRFQRALTKTELLLKLLFFSEWRQTTATTKRLL